MYTENRQTDTVHAMRGAYEGQCAQMKSAWSLQPDRPSCLLRGLENHFILEASALNKMVKGRLH